MIETDSKIEVTEHISVYAAGEDIIRGIVHEIPLYRENSDGKRARMKYKVLDVECDGYKA